MNKHDLFNLIGCVKVSNSRMKILYSLENGLKMPTEIAKETGYRITLVSNTLHDLKQKNLVVCINEELTKGRLYKITEDGKEILEYLNEHF